MIEDMSMLKFRPFYYFFSSFLLYLFSSINSLVEDKDVMLVFDFDNEYTLYFRDYLVVEFDEYP